MNCIIVIKLSKSNNLNKQSMFAFTDTIQLYQSINSNTEKKRIVAVFDKTASKKKTYTQY